MSLEAKGRETDGDSLLIWKWILKVHTSMQFLFFKPRLDQGRISICLFFAIFWKNGVLKKILLSRPYDWANFKNDLFTELSKNSQNC